MHPSSDKQRRRSRRVPLTILPAFAALVACGGGHNSYDPCDPGWYVQAACDSAVVHRGYWYGGAWYPHSYPFAGIYYLSQFNRYRASGGTVRSMAPTVYAPSAAAPARAGVVRGGFGGIGEGHGASGS